VRALDLLWSILLLHYGYRLSLLRSLPVKSLRLWFGEELFWVGGHWVDSSLNFEIDGEFLRRTLLLFYILVFGGLLPVCEDLASLGSCVLPTGVLELLVDLSQSESAMLLVAAAEVAIVLLLSRCEWS